MNIFKLYIIPYSDLAGYYQVLLVGHKDSKTAYDLTADYEKALSQAKEKNPKNWTVDDALDNLFAMGWGEVNFPQVQVFT